MKRIALQVGLVSLLALAGQGCEGKSDDGSATTQSGGGSGGTGSTVRTTEPCEVGAAECVSDKVGRLCPESDDRGWVYFSCGDTELCDMGECVLDPDAPGRLGLCEEGEAECVSAALARTCARGGDAWLPLACQAGTVCSDGECVVVPENLDPVLICEAGTTKCFGTYLIGVCREDGSAWDTALCPADTQCEDGACTPYIDAGRAVDAGDAG